MKTVTDSTGKQYRQTESGTCYHMDTPEDLIIILEGLIGTRTKVKIYLGHASTGECWPEEHDSIGTIGRSTGWVKIPLLVPARSYGGPALMDNHVLKIVTYPDRRLVYQHPNFKQHTVEIKQIGMPGGIYETWYNNHLHGRHTSKLSAQICASKLR